MDKQKVWFVTGASQGLGLVLVKRLLAAGYRVAATSRNGQTLRNAVAVIDHENFLPLAVDLGNRDSIADAVQQTIGTFGQIDVLVNNAGFGMAGTVEEIPEQQIKAIFDVNVLAAINVTQLILPEMRRRRAGYIINVGSVAGLVGAPGWAIYSATKAAIAAFSEVLALDVKEFGISVTVAEPSGFRTGFLTQQSMAYTESTIEGYRVVKETLQRYLAADGHQAGDPEKAAAIFIQLAENGQPPLHLYLGQDAYHRASEKLTGMLKEMEAWKTTTLSADY